MTVKVMSVDFFKSHNVVQRPVDDFVTFPSILFGHFYKKFEEKYEITREFILDQIKKWIDHQKFIQDGLGEICRVNIILKQIEELGSKTIDFYDNPFEGRSPLER